ncbi:MAG: zinc ribbon domain-containing protein [Ruminococcus sp.]|nr:zinc ribbon domain-containing protein [Ruminococcus sp.]
MPFCGECGYKMKEGAKFCTRCGSKVKQINAQSSVICPSCGDALIPGKKFCANCGWSQDGLQENQNKHTKREVVFEGDIHKCPNCGEIVTAFSAFCTTCGYEIRNGTSSSSVKEFALRISQIPNTSNITAKADFVSNYPVPNTREDLMEFMLLIKSHVNDKSDLDFDIVMLKAWKSKLEQIYEKAKICMKDDARFDEINKNYLETKKLIKRKLNRKLRRDWCLKHCVFLVGFWGTVILIVICFAIMLNA